MFDHYRHGPTRFRRCGAGYIACSAIDAFSAISLIPSTPGASISSWGIPAEKLHCVHNGFDPQDVSAFPSLRKSRSGRSASKAGRRQLSIQGASIRRRGLELAIEAAKRLPDHLFLLVGAHGQGTIEALANGVGNVRIIPWQQPDALARYIFAADVLLIPPSLRPLAEFGSTVIPLKLYLYMGSGRPILAGDTPDVSRDPGGRQETQFCADPIAVDALVAGIGALTGDESLADISQRPRLRTAVTSPGARAPARLRQSWSKPIGVGTDRVRFLEPRAIAAPGSNNQNAGRFT